VDYFVIRFWNFVGDFEVFPGLLILELIVCDGESGVDGVGLYDLMGSISWVMFKSGFLVRGCSGFLSWVLFFF